MQSATRKIAMVANTYASQVPLPASAQTSGIVAAGVVVGAIVETDCARVSRGDRIPCRKPNSVVGEFSGGVGSIRCYAPCRQARLGWDCTTPGDVIITRVGGMKGLKFAACMSPSARLGQRRCRSPPLIRKINL